MSRKMSETSPQVLALTSLGPDKAYCLPLLQQTIKKNSGIDWLLVADELVIPADWLAELPNCHVHHCHLGEETTRIRRISRMREWSRQYFLGQDYTHAWWLDGDTLPPSNSLQRLLSQKLDLVCGLVALRNVAEPTIGVLSSLIPGAAGDLMTAIPEIEQLEVTGMGLACALASRQAMEAAAFKTELVETIGEDVQWCWDLRLKGCSLGVCYDIACWHLGEDNVAVRPKLGPVSVGTVWADHGWQVRNQFGIWTRGVPRFNLTEAEIAALPPGFVSGKFYELSLERLKMEEL